MAIDHISGKPTVKEAPYAKEQEIMQKEYGLTSDEVKQILSNVKSAKDFRKIMNTLERAKDGITVA